MAFESHEQQWFALVMVDKRLSRWLDEINGLLQKPDDAVSELLLCYLNLVSYMCASRTLENNHFKEAEKYLTNYEKADPENPEVYFLKAT